MPHRALRLDLSCCHQCGAPLALGRCTTRLGADILEWQQWLLGAVSGASTDTGPFGQAEICASVRSLLSLLTFRRNHSVIREALHLPRVSLPADRLQFEHARVHERVLLMETLAACLAGWPSMFRKGADAAGLTQMSFRRLKLPSTLRLEVERLPPGFGRDRTYVPKVFDKELLRLERKDRKACRALRARRLRALVGLE